MGAQIQKVEGKKLFLCCNIKIQNKLLAAGNLGKGGSDIGTVRISDCVSRRG